MPIYEYQCETCGQRTEAIQRFGDAPLTECPHCGGPLKKMFSAPAFQLKGSGWYKTDYAAPAAKAAASGSNASSASSESADSAKLVDTEKKPATETSGAASTGSSGSAAATAGTGSATKPAASSTSSE